MHRTRRVGRYRNGILGTQPTQGAKFQDTGMDRKLGWTRRDSSCVSEGVEGECIILARIIFVVVEHQYVHRHHRYLTEYTTFTSSSATALPIIVIIQRVVLNTERLAGVAFLHKYNSILHVTSFLRFDGP